MPRDHALPCRSFDSALRQWKSISYARIAQDDGFLKGVLQWFQLAWTKKASIKKPLAEAKLDRQGAGFLLYMERDEQVIPSPWFV